MTAVGVQSTDRISSTLAQFVLNRALAEFAVAIQQVAARNLFSDFQVMSPDRLHEERFAQCCTLVQDNGDCELWLIIRKLPIAFITSRRVRALCCCDVAHWFVHGISRKKCCRSRTDWSYWFSLTSTVGSDIGVDTHLKSSLCFAWGSVCFFFCSVALLATSDPKLVFFPCVLGIILFVGNWRSHAALG